jgi:hypothetical protein
MQFTRKKRRGQNGRVRKTWLAPNGYRIVWRKEAYGIELPPRYQALVKTTVPATESFEMWDFVDQNRHCYKTMKAATDAAEKHQRLWTQALEAKSARALKEILGSIPFGYPTWVQRKLNRNLRLILTDNRAVVAEEEECESPNEPIEVSATSQPPIEAGPITSGPVSSVMDEVGITTPPKRRTRLKGTSTADKSPAPTAKEPAKEPSESAEPPTKGGKRSTKRTVQRGKRSSNSVKKPSKNSRQRKSTPSGS